VSETLEIAKDVARKLLEAQKSELTSPKLEPVGDDFDYPLVVGS
jgi:hypothetical protein